MSHIELDLKARSDFPEEIILVYGSLRTGGIETLIVRMANYLVSTGAKVFVCCTAGGALEALLDNRVDVISYTDPRDLVISIKTHHNQKISVSTTLIMSFDPISAARALMVEILLSKSRQVTHVSGVFHPRAYFMRGERRDRTFLYYLLACAIGKCWLFFMNEECRKSHSIKWGMDLSKSPLLALPINLLDAIWQPSDKKNLRIVSVGRLVDFKAYNLGAAKIIKTCHERGLEVTWDIFGDGSLYNSIKSEIEALGVARHVRLMGTLDYNDFSKKVSGYDLFIGIGTAALEAAMVGVPTICATEDADSCCYGYLYELPFGNVGELQADKPTVEITDLIESYSLLSQAERLVLSVNSRSVAKKYGMPQFVNSIVDITTIDYAPPPKIVKRIVAELYLFTTESSIAKFIRDFLTKKKLPI